MEKLICKLGYRLPELLARAAAGDPTAIATLVAAGGIAVISLFKEKR